ncbi:hypothetical protein [Melittangium boletus]|uniref:Uncharacterized protein n=1 Tax=Melittangium boletus DSM 14713 TaxID=1294270 RepID=A0A250IIV9_9BACT|nr:hypothetical protein [Melittangium boletus]ATB31087.1 hypothetical protein MEBOL_004549 [Melittangium boletus DSM 14713]
MPRQTRYLLTVDSDTGTAVKLERLGEAGELTEVPLGMLSGVSSAPPPHGGVMAPSPQSLVINIYMGGPQPVAQPSYSVREPPGPGARPMGPGGPGGAGSSSGEGGTSS